MKMKASSGAEHHICISLIGFVPQQVVAWNSSHLSSKVMICDSSCRLGLGAREP